MFEEYKFQKNLEKLLGVSHEEFAHKEKNVHYERNIRKLLTGVSNILTLGIIIGTIPLSCSEMNSIVGEKSYQQQEQQKSPSLKTYSTNNFSSRFQKNQSVKP